MNGALRVRITRDDVGRRVTVRRRLQAGPGEPSTTDVVGRLLAWSDAGELTVERRDGMTETVPLSDVVGAKVIPEPRPRPGPGTLGA